MALILGSRFIQINQSPMTSISIRRFRDFFDITIVLSNTTELTDLREILQQNNIRTDEHLTDRILLIIQDTTNFAANQLHSILTNFSSHFGSHEEISRQVSEILNDRGRGLMRYYVREILQQNNIRTEEHLVERITPYQFHSILTNFSQLGNHEEIPRQISEFQEALRKNPTVRTEVVTGINAEKLSDKEIEIPDEYCCPLSQSIMSDPVYFPEDPTKTRFERSWIRNWLSEHGSTHPLTRAVVSFSAFQPDTELKTEIDDFVEKSVSPKHGMT